MRCCATCGVTIEPGAHHCPTTGCPNGPKPVKVDFDALAQWRPPESPEIAGQDDDGEPGAWWS